MKDKKVVLLSMNAVIRRSKETVKVPIRSSELVKSRSYSMGIVYVRYIKSVK